MTVQDATEAVEEKVKQRLKNKKSIPKSLRAAVANRAARAASGIASSPMIASMLGDKIPQKMIDKMEEKGITVAVDEVFREGTCRTTVHYVKLLCLPSSTRRVIVTNNLLLSLVVIVEGPYVVFQIQVKKVDAVLLAKSKKKEDSEAGYFEMGSFVGFGLGLIGTNNQQWVEQGYLPKLVQKKLESAMGEILAEKLERKKMLAETYVLGEAKQARYFFAKYREIQSMKPIGFSNRIRNAGNNGQGPLLLRRNSSGLTAEKECNGDTGASE